MDLMELLDEVRRRWPEQGWELAGSREPHWLRSLVLDSREVGDGDLFFCVPGLVVDGHDYADQAVAQGAAAVVVERPLGLRVPEIRVAAVRPAMAAMAAAFYGDPSRELGLVGVTGTNGKTTITQMVHHICTHAGNASATIGTLSGVRTTPEAVDLQAQLRDLVEAKVRYVSMEVSSHALDQHRVDSTWFGVTVFTNLSPDHLDYHGDMVQYFEAKRMLFHPERTGRAIVNTDDPWGARLVEEMDAAIEVTSVSRRLAVDLVPTLSGSTFQWRGLLVALPIAGLFNVDNALAAAETAVALGVEPAAVAAGLASLPQIPGRFENVGGGDFPNVIVDYAHTPDGLEQLLTSVREVSDSSEVVVVFGAGGDRDRPKRPLMGETAERLADRVVVTSDNPRSEDPDSIISQILVGMASPEATTVHVDPDRRAAIEQALRTALGAPNPRDVVVVIAGKGHEVTQTIGDQVLPFDDRIVARELLEALR